MPDPVARCPDHGFFPGQHCPVCDDAGTRVCTGAQRRRLSKYLSGALRHFPDDAGLTLDAAGWTDFDAVAAAAEQQYGWADAETVAGVLATDPKGRFERSEGRVRAAYGHSVDVTLDAGGTPVPDTLYHGTAPRNLDAIFAEGLRPMARQQVHLSGTVAAAREVGARHAGDPVVLTVDAAAMLEDGHDITKRGHEVYTTDRVPPAYLSER